MITAVVIGGRGLIGSAICSALRSQNVELVYAPAHKHDVDATDYNSLRRMFAAYSRIDLLVNCFAYHEPGAFEDHRPTNWQRTVDVTLTGVMNSCHAVLPSMDGGGDIINIASWAGVVPHLYLAAYGAAKAGVIAFSAALDVELSPLIRVGCISPAKVSANGLTPDSIARDVVTMWNTPRHRRLGHRTIVKVRD
jgi:NAD(P)-dependent dehydrogenase (short-subunit alcohol dehydrogenase family)